MKKTIIFLLVLCTLVSISSPALAYIPDLSFSDGVVMQYNGHGEYTITNAINSIFPKTKSDSKSISVGDAVFAEATNDSDIYRIDSDRYLTLARDNTYLLSDKISVNIDNFSSNEEVFDRYKISEDLRVDMENVIDTQRELGNNDLVIEVYAPSITSSGVQLFGNEPIGEFYYTYVGDYGITYYLKDVTVKYSNLSTGMIKITGTNILAKAKGFISIAIDIGSSLNKTVNAFSSVLGFIGSAYDVYKAVSGEVYQGKSGDYMYTNLIYDRVLKATYVREISGTYNMLSYMSYKAWLNRHDTYQYYGETGKGQLTQPSLNLEIYSPNFKDPAHEAVYGPLTDSYLYATIHGLKVKLSGE